ncbi:MAG: hypothetical protein GX248_12245 [Peptococcaceae bacterium]|jgi:hypothetical protein|nr:hypothetical protein [Peptococcaceae bacterium]
MDFDSELVHRAQMLLTLDHSLSQVKEILLREGYPDKQVQELIDATEDVLNYFVPPVYDDNKIAIDIRHANKDPNLEASPDILVDRVSGKVELLTPQLQETWRVANEIRKTLKYQHQYRYY